jgi:phosphatidylglycerophosphatase A
MNLDVLAKITSTFFYIGYFPVASGSFATIAGVMLSAGLAHSIAAYVIVWSIITGLGFWLSGRMERIEQDKDPGCVVIDEVSGMMLSMFLLPPTWPVMITSYFLFRAFDMFKIYPGNVFEAKRGSFGIMMDDIMAGIYTNLIMQIALRLS